MDRQALEALLKDMSTEEKVMQLVQIPGSEYEADAEITGIERGQVKDRVKRLAGSTLGIWGTKRLRKIQEQYMPYQSSPIIPSQSGSHCHPPGHFCILRSIPLQQVQEC